MAKWRFSRSAQFGVRLHISAIYFGDSAGKTGRNEAPLEVVILHSRDTPCPWLIACDPNMEPDVFCQSTGCNEGGEEAEIMFDYVIACGCARWSYSG